MRGPHAPPPAGRAPLSARTAALLLLAFGAVWLLALAGTAVTPPLDNVEQSIWLRSLQWGYYKHPPLPTWLAAAATAAGGHGPLPLYLLGAACTLASLLIFWQLLRECRGPQFAHVALLAALCVTFYNGRLYYFNHNVVMMPAIAAMVWACWRLSVRPSLATWALLGLCAGLGMLAKYQTAVAGVCVLLWWLQLRGWRHPVHRVGLWLGAAVAALVFLPHALWLWQHDFAPLHYAQHSSLGVGLAPLARLKHTLLWLADWLFNRPVLAWLVLAAAWWGARPQPGDGAAAPTATAPEASRRFLLLWGMAPALMMALLGLALGTDLQLQWLTAFTLWTVAAVMVLLPSRALAWPARRAAGRAFAAAQVLLLAQLLLSSVYGPERWRSVHWRNFPSDRLAQGVAQPARELLGGPIDIISGPYKEAGALALRMAEHPRVLIDGKLAISPWISAEELRSARVISLFPAAELPAGAYRAMPGWAWRPGGPDHPKTPSP
ncbi:glycosyltransferase family 39 protein [Comamonas flocculans]|uniref:Glycosyltransferase family 39 protein n=1 Tax=Comamonas flocculans TaxID=2597701 RepID=A0A5B8RX53_9BURK|nr:glycosyltransferase family 39 protein [Comamonas flocculans]QEA14166.1 glycosyltransferase family 39 protein [Comamonas flocculans]